MPLHNWIKCTGDQLKYVRTGAEGDPVSDELHWVRLYDEYLSRYGLNRKYEKYLRVLKERALLQADFVLTRDRFKLTEIDIKTAEIDQIQRGFQSGQKIETTLIFISRWLGFHVNAKQVTVTEYFDLIDQYQKAQENG
jgi:hypothetical protein